LIDPSGFEFTEQQVFWHRQFGTKEREPTCHYLENMLGRYEEYRVYREGIRDRRAALGIDTFDVPGDSSIYRDPTGGTGENPESERRMIVKEWLLGMIWKYPLNMTPTMILLSLAPGC
jgi:hypothetical protein